MPVEIVTGPSNPETGEISQHDLLRITEDFENFVEVDSSIQRVVRKADFITIPRNILLALLEEENEYDYVNIHFGVTLPNQKNCGDDFKTDISNQLTVVINRAKVSGNLIFDKTSVGDFVITVGFKSKIAALTPPCCGKPGGGGN